MGRQPFIAGNWKMNLDLAVQNFLVRSVCSILHNFKTPSQGPSDSSGIIQILNMYGSVSSLASLSSI